MRHIQYQGETLPPSLLVLAFHLVLHNFYIYPNAAMCLTAESYVVEKRFNGNLEILSVFV